MTPQRNIPIFPGLPRFVSPVELVLFGGRGAGARKFKSSGLLLTNDVPWGMEMCTLHNCKVKIYFSIHVQ